MSVSAGTPSWFVLRFFKIVFHFLWRMLLFPVSGFLLHWCCRQAGFSFWYKIRIFLDSALLREDFSPNNKLPHRREGFASCSCGLQVVCSISRDLVVSIGEAELGIWFVEWCEISLLHVRHTLTNNSVLSLSAKQRLKIILSAVLTTRCA